jgi:hypothetical protein
MIINTTILSWVTFAYFASSIFYIFRMVTGKEFWGPLGSFVALAGLIAQTLALILRWVQEPWRLCDSLCLPFHGLCLLFATCQ